MAKVGLIAHPMQNFIRIMIGTLFLICGGLIMIKLRIIRILVVFTLTDSMEMRLE